MSTSVSGVSSESTQAWSGASTRKSPTQKMENLFQKIDTSGSGTITKAQFEQAFQTMNPSTGSQQASADAVWAKLDPNGTGSVSKQDFVSGMTSMMSGSRHHHGGGAANASSAVQMPTTSTSSLSSLGSNIDTTA